MIYKNLTFRDEDKAEWNKKYCDKHRSSGIVPNTSPNAGSLIES